MTVLLHLHRSVSVTVTLFPFEYSKHHVPVIITTSLIKLTNYDANTTLPEFLLDSLLQNLRRLVVVKNAFVLTLTH